MKSFNIATLITLLFISYSCNSRVNPEITADELRTHVDYLASEELKGRLSGTEGDRLAAAYIEDAFRKTGLIIPNDSAIGEFEITTGIRLDSATRLSVNGSPVLLGDDFVPYSMSSPGELSAAMVFAGYGFNIRQDSLEWNDFAGIEVSGKVALILLGAPEHQNPGEDPFESAGSIRTKVLNARDQGASAVVLVAGPLYDQSDVLAFDGRLESPAGLPVLRIRRAVIDAALNGLGLSVSDLEQQLNANQHPVHISVEIQTDLAVRLEVTSAQTRNVLGYLPAADTGLRHEWLVIGAHFDHLGQGGPGSGSRVPDTLASHYGADDNASGVAGVLELAACFKAREKELKRSVLFIAFTGEELGLLGSKQFVQSGWLSPDRIACMLNMDMIGRPNEDRRIAVGGTGTASQFAGLLENLPDSLFSYSFSPEGYGPSDHAAFYQESRPVLYFSTGAHEDYHTPADTPEKLNYEVMAGIVDVISGLAWELTQFEESLQFTEAGPRTATSGRRNLKVTLGIMPDFAGTESKGLRVDLVTPGKPAHKGGMLKGDVITGINGLPVNNIYDYMTRLQQLKLGEVVSVDVNRNGEKQVLIIQL